MPPPPYIGDERITTLKKFTREFVSTVKHLNHADPNIIVFIIYGLLYDVVMNLYKPFAIKFLDRIGGNELHISMFNSLPGIAAILAIIPGAVFIGRFMKKKNITSVFFAFSRVFILLTVLVPFMPKGGEPVAFVILVAAVNFFDAISQCSLQSFLGENFNGFTRARAISLRNRFGTIFVLLVTLITGLAITFIPKTDGQRILLYQFFFALSFIFGIIEIMVFRRFRERPRGEQSQTDDPKISRPGFGAVKRAVADRNFLKFLLPTILLYFAWHTGWPLGNILQIKTLKADEMWITANAVASAVGGFFSATLWVKLISKKGNYFTLVVCAVLIAFNMFFNSLCPNLVVMTLIGAYAGAVSLGVNTVMLNGLLTATPDRDRVVYIGVYNTFVNISLAVTPYLSLFLFNMLGIRLASATVGLMRLLAGAVLFLTLYRGSRKKEPAVS